uniref:BTB domain-containing protein n=1 Tax=Panagrolaimus davidi TaxID=227884 RepID=A0A914PAC6_9BILA
MKKIISWIFCWFILHLAATATEISDDKSTIDTSVPVLKATTRIGVFNATFSWKIENIHLFDFGTRNDIRYLSGPTLTAIDQTNNKKVYTIICKINPDWTSERQYNRYNNNKNYRLTKYKVVCDFSIPPIKIEYKYVVNGTTYDGQMIEKSYLNLIDTVEIIVKAFYYTTNESKQSTILFSSPIFDRKPNTLGEDLLKLFKKDSDSQFVIDCAGEEILAYKPIMQARSSTFNKLLSNGTDRLRIEDFSPKIVKKVVEFCNNDTIEDYENEETNIFVMAFTYGIQSLLTYASKEMVKNANIENAVTRFKFAHFYHEEPLKKWFFEYIIQNFVEVSKTTAFKTLDPELYKPILEELLKQKKII